MKKIISLLFIAITFFSNTSAQTGLECNLQVEAVLSPRPSRTYFTNDTFNFELRIKNNGPNSIVGADSFKISYSIGDGSINSFFADTIISLGSNGSLQAGAGRNYIVHKDFIINGNNTFSACGNVTGTVVYPTNTSKVSNKCVQFVVDLEDLSIDIQKTYYLNEEIIVELNQQFAKEIRIFDITGKLIWNQTQVRTKKLKIPFSNKPKGLYFTTVVDEGGNQATSKFVVN